MTEAQTAEEFAMTRLLFPWASAALAGVLLSAAFTTPARAEDDYSKRERKARKEAGKAARKEAKAYAKAERKAAKAERKAWKKRAKRGEIY